MKLAKLITLREALASDGYFGRLLAGYTWRAWRVLLIAIVGEELTEDERPISRPQRRQNPLYGRPGGL
jgi:hypothetical protein